MGRRTFGNELSYLREDLRRVRGWPFTHFLCPITLLDESVELCKAHIVNQAFANSSRQWTIQRKDVDNFYGSYFEGPFLDIQFKLENMSVFDALVDRNLRTKLRPILLINEIATDYFVPNLRTPEKFPRIFVQTSQGSTELALKTSFDRILQNKTLNLAVEVNKDLRIESFVSVLKAAHLTLFRLLGYKYARSSSGIYLGRYILGEFFLQNRGKRSREILSQATSFFRPFETMVRPIVWSGLSMGGTISDRRLLVCVGANRKPWATLVFVKTSSQLHAVMIPFDGNTPSCDGGCYSKFVESGQDFVEVSFMRLAPDNSHWELDDATQRLNWPRTGILFPDSNV